MKFVTEDRKGLLAAVAATTRVALVDGSSFAMSGILIEVNGRVTFTGTSASSTVQASLDADCQTPGVVLIPSRLLEQVVKALPATTTTFELIDGVLNVSAGTASYAVNTMKAEEFPRFSEVEGATITVDAATLVRALNDVSVSVSEDQNRAALTTVLFDPEDDHVRLVSTDSYRLTCIDVPGISLGEWSANVPGAVIDVLARSLKDGAVTIVLNANAASFSNDDFKVTTRLVEFEYPLYRNIVDKPREATTTVECDPALLTDAVRRCSVLEGRSKSIRLEATNSGILVSKTTETGTAADNVPAAVRGDDIMIHFQAGQLIEALSLFEGSVTLKLAGPQKPAHLVSDDRPHVFHLLMPHKG